MQQDKVMTPVIAVIEIPDALNVLLAQCETVCVSGCYGLAAFDIDRKLIGVWAEDGNVEQLRYCIGLLESLVDEFFEEIAQYRVKGLSDFDEVQTGTVWKEWFKQWKTNAEDVLKELSE